MVYTKKRPKQTLFIFRGQNKLKLTSGILLVMFGGAFVRFRTSRDPRDTHVLKNWAIVGLQMGVFKNSGTPKWMVYNGKPF